MKFPRNFAKRLSVSWFVFFEADTIPPKDDPATWIWVGAEVEVGFGLGFFQGSKWQDRDRGCGLGQWAIRTAFVSFATTLTCVTLFFPRLFRYIRFLYIFRFFLFFFLWHFRVVCRLCFAACSKQQNELFHVFYMAFLLAALGVFCARNWGRLLPMAS